MTFRRPLATVALFASALALAACGSTAKSTPKVPGDAVALVGTTAITKVDFDHLMAIGLASYTARSQPAPKVGTAEYTKLKQDAMKFLFDRAVIRQEAKVAGIVLDPKAVDASLQQLKTQVGTAAQWDAKLKAAKATEADYRVALEVQQLAQKLLDKIAKQQGAITPAAIQARYTKDHEQPYINIASTRKVEHILIGPKDGSTPKDADLPGYLATAKKVIALLKGGADFGKLVTKYSTDPGAAQNKGVYDVTMAGFDPAFAKASFALKTGEVTKEPVKSAYGYHVIKAMADPTPQYYKTLDQVKAEITTKLQSEQSQNAGADWIKSIEAKYLLQTTFAATYGLAPVTTAAAGTTTG